MSESMQALTIQIEQRLNSRMEPFNLMLAARVRRAGLRVIRSEKGFSVHGSCAAASLALSALVNGEQHGDLQSDVALPSIAPPSLLEKAAIVLQGGSRALLERDMPWRLRCGLLWLVLSLQQSLANASAPFRQYRDASAAVLSFVFSEPCSSVQVMLRQHSYWRLRNYAHRLTHLYRRERSPALLARFDWPEREAYLRTAARGGESRVLVTIHMGDFIGAFRVMSAAVDPERAVISLQREGDRCAQQRLAAGPTSQHQVLVHGQDSPARIVSALRRGGQSLAILFDLGSDFGETTQVQFFGNNARFVRGPAELAILGRARLFPFVCYSEAGREVIDMAPAFLPVVHEGEQLQQAVARVTQTLVSLAETWIRRHPQQWKYLDVLPSYLVPENKV